MTIDLTANESDICRGSNGDLGQRRFFFNGQRDFRRIQQRRQCRLDHQQGSIIALDTAGDAAVFNGKTVKFSSTGQYNLPTAGLKYSWYSKPKGFTYDEVKPWHAHEYVGMAPNAVNNRSWQIAIRRAEQKGCGGGAARFSLLPAAGRANKGLLSYNVFGQENRKGGHMSRRTSTCPRVSSSASSYRVDLWEAIRRFLLHSGLALVADDQKL